MSARTVIELKTWPAYFSAIWDGSKTFELRERRDRPFAPGVVLLLREWDDEEGYSGREIRALVNYVLEGTGEFGLSRGHVCMAFDVHDTRDLRDRDGEGDKWIAYQRSS